MILIAANRRLHLLDSIAQRIALSASRSLRRGSLQLTFPDGGYRLLGREGSWPAARLQVNSSEFFSRVLRGGEIAFGEAYMDGLWDSDDLTSVLVLGILNRSSVPLALKKVNDLSRAGSRRLHLARRNTLQGSRSNVEAHYDLSNEFFASFLDSSMTYSSAVFTEASQRLEEAQRNKHAILCRKAELEAENRVLEIGCGWGGFALHAARAHGCKVDAITLSQQQAELARCRVESSGLADRVSIGLSDYRDVSGRYDRIFSIEMFEAVGAEYFGAFFEKCDELLKPGGRLVMQTISVPERTFAALRDGVNWMQKYIFPGGMLPSLAQIERAIARTGLIISDVEDIASHYVLTLQRWRERFEANLSTVRDLGFDERFIRMWRYYLCAAEAGFITRSTGDLQIVFDKPSVT